VDPEPTEVADGLEEESPSDEVIALAEEPGVWLPSAPERMVFHGAGFSFVQSGRSAWVQRLRLEDDDDEIQRVVNHASAILSIKEIPEAQWWLGEKTTPPGLAKFIADFGLEPDDPAEMTSLTIAKEPAGVEPTAEPEIEVRKVETLEDELTALELDWEGFDVPEEERVLRRAEARTGWDVLQRDGRQTTFLAYLDDEPVGFGRAVYTRLGGLLLGGVTVPEARGKGVYMAVVHARWREAVERGTPRLTVCAGPMSAPILEGVGFSPIGKVRLFKQLRDD
jgi:hypothetical protein